MRKTFAISFAVVCLTSSVASAAITAQVSANPDPAPGLTSVTVTAFGNSGEIVNSFAGITISGLVHNVIPGFGSSALFGEDWAADSANGASLAAWSIYDTYVLFDSTNDFVFQLGGPLAEGANDASDPAGLGLNNVVAATSGLSTFGHALSSDQMVIIPALAANSVPFLQVVYPTSGPVPTLSMTFLDSVTGDPSSISDVLLSAVPEPSTFVLAGMGLIGMAFMRRRRVC